MNYRQTVAAVNNVISQYRMALTLRQIYYRLVAAGLIPNRRTAYNGISAQLVKARESGEVDENRIVDRSRSINDISFDSPEDFLAAVLWTAENRYVRRFWKGQDNYVEIWVEKDALSQVIANAVRDFNTIVCPSRGYSSYSYLRDAVARFDRYTTGDDAPDEVVVLHLGDHDPSGYDMSRDLQARLSDYSGGTTVTVKRIALTSEQVEQYNLIPNPTKVTDSRSPAYEAKFGNECWELDAIEPDELVRIVQEAVEDEITDPDAWAEIKGKDKGEREALVKVFKELKSNFERGS